MTTKNKLPQMKGDLGYGLGFFCGCLVGMVGTYLVVTPDGQKLKAKIIKEYQHNLQTLTLNELLPNQHRQSESKSLHSISLVIKKLKSKLMPFDNSKPTESKSATHFEPKKKHYFKKK